MRKKSKSLDREILVKFSIRNIHRDAIPPKHLYGPSLVGLTVKFSEKRS